MDWRDAIHQSFAPLERSGAIEGRYVKKIIDSTIKHGDFMVIGNGIMLAHGGPADGVNELGIGLNLFKQSFKSRGGQNIRIVITLAPVDAKLQVPFLEVMLRYASDSKWLKQVDDCTSKNELMNLLQQSHLLDN